MPRDDHHCSKSGLYTFGIDVSSKRLDCAEVPKRKRLNSYNNTGPEIDRLVALLQERQQEGLDILVVVEATGGYERKLCEALWAAGIPLHLANPKWTRDYAKSIGQLAKTDRADARVLADYGQTQRHRLRLTSRPDVIRAQIRALLDYRRRIVEEAAARRMILKQEALPGLQSALEQDIERLAKQAEQLRRQVAAIIAANKTLAELSRRVQTIPGVGPNLAAELIADLPELGTLSAAKIAALAGLAPFADSSGDRNGRRHIAGGRANIRNALYMPAVAAVKANPTLSAFYKKLIAAGKRPKVAITAVMRKLLVIINAIVRTASDWKNTENSIA